MNAEPDEPSEIGRSQTLVREARHLAPLATAGLVIAGLAVTAGLRATILWANQTPNTPEALARWRGTIATLSVTGLILLAGLMIAVFRVRYPPLRRLNIAAIVVLAFSLLLARVPLVGAVMGGTGLLAVAAPYVLALLRGVVDLWRPSARQRPTVVELLVPALAATLALFLFALIQKWSALAWSAAID